VLTDANFAEFINAASVYRRFWAVKLTNQSPDILLKANISLVIISTNTVRRKINDSVGMATINENIPSNL
jgi:hypothetical protein